MKSFVAPAKQFVVVGSRAMINLKLPRKHPERPGTHNKSLGAFRVGSNEQNTSLMEALEGEKA